MNTGLMFAILLMAWIAVVHPVARWLAGRALAGPGARNRHRPMLHSSTPPVTGNRFPRKVS